MNDNTELLQRLQAVAVKLHRGGFRDASGACSDAVGAIFGLELELKRQLETVARLRALLDSEAA